MRLAAIFVGPDFVGDQWQHILLQLGLNVLNLEYLTIYTYLRVTPATEESIYARLLCHTPATHAPYGPLYENITSSTKPVVPNALSSEDHDHSQQITVTL